MRVTSTLRRWGIAAMALVVALALALAACSDATAPSYSMTGSWSGVYTDEIGNFISVFANMADDRGTIFGIGNLAISDSEVFVCTHLGIEGTRSDQTVSLSFTCLGFEGIDFSGSLTGPSTVTGQLSGAGYSGEVITMTKRSTPPIE